MVDVPGATAKTVPDADTVAIDVADDVHAFIP